MNRIVNNLICALVAMGFLMYYHDQTVEPRASSSRTRGCMSNRNSIDKMVGVWESQNVAIPADGLTVIVLSSHGRILKMQAPPSLKLRPAGLELYNFVKDRNVFVCPATYNWDPSTPEHPAYVWVMDSQPIAFLQGRPRGTFCLAHAELEP